ncbi:hypothetical protein GCM10010149_32970 [Nonomuraea roseoviolacea subsp. roseoviolacea]
MVRWEAAAVVTLGTILGLVIAMGTLVLLHLTSGSSYLRPAPQWWLFSLVAAGAAVARLATSACPRAEPRPYPAWRQPGRSEPPRPVSGRRLVQARCRRLPTVRAATHNVHLSSRTAALRDAG